MRWSFEERVWLWHGIIYGREIEVCRLQSSMDSSLFVTHSGFKMR